MSEIPTVAPIKLTKKQFGFVRDYVLTGNGTQSAMRNYNLKNNFVASNVASENLLKPYIAEAVKVEEARVALTLREALEREGVGPQFLAQKVKQLLKTKGYQAVDRGLAHATKIYGLAEDQMKPVGGNTYNILFSSDTQEAVKALEDTLKVKLLANVEQAQTSVEVKPEGAGGAQSA